MDAHIVSVFDVQTKTPSYMRPVILSTMSPGVSPEAILFAVSVLRLARQSFRLYWARPRNAYLT